MASAPEESKRKPENVSDYLICHDENVCEIKPGKETEVAKNFEAMAVDLSYNQRALLAEEIMARGLFTEKQATDAMELCDDTGKFSILEFMAKVLEPGHYDKIFFILLNHFTTKYPQRARLDELFTTEASDRYADFAMLDIMPNPEVKEKRANEFISSEETAARAADVVGKYGQYGFSPTKYDVVAYLMKHFPNTMVKRLEILQQYDGLERDKNKLLMHMFGSLPALARRQAEKEVPNNLPGWAKSTRTVFNKTARERVDRLTMDRKNKIDDSKRVIAADLAGKFLDSLNNEQKKLLLNQDVYREDDIARMVIDNLDKFVECGAEVIVKALCSLARYGIRLSEKNLLAIQKAGFENVFVDEVCRTGEAGSSIFEDSYVSGYIEKLAPKNLVRILKLIEEQNFSLLLKNVYLLQKYKLLPPAEFIKKCAAQEDDWFYLLYNAEDFLAYAGGKDRLKVDKSYRLAEAGVTGVLRKFFIAQPEYIFSQPKIFIKIFPKDGQKELLRRYFSQEEFSISSVFHAWSQLADICLSDPDIKKTIMNAIKEDPQAVNYAWKDVETIIPDRAERASIIFGQPEFSMSRDVMKDIVADWDRFIIFVDKIKKEEKFATVIDLISYLWESPGIKRSEGVELKEWFRQKLLQNPDVFLYNPYPVAHFLINDPAMGREFAPLMRERFDFWCDQKPEAMWNARRMFMQYLDAGEFQSLIQKNKFKLGNDIMADFVYDTSNRYGAPDDDPQVREFMNELGKEILEMMPDSLYDDEGASMLPPDGLSVKDENIREFVFEKLSRQEFFKFYAKKIRNQFTISKKLPEEKVTPEFVELARRSTRLSMSPAKELFLILAAALPAKEADRYLKIAEALALLGQDKKLADDLGQDKNPGHIIDAMHGLVADIFKNELQVNINKDSHSPLLERPNSVLLYGKLHADKPAVVALLKQSVNAELTGNYADWRYFAGNGEDGFNNLRENKLLPQNLTFEQYQSWVTNDSLEQNTDISVNIDDINAANEKILIGAIEFGHIGAESANDIFALEKNSTMLEDLENPLRVFQSKLAEYKNILSENKKRKKIGLAEIPFDKNEYDKTKAGMDEYLSARGREIEYRRAYIYLGRPCRVTAEEIASGRIRMFGEKGGEVPLARVFEFLAKIFKESPGFLNDIDRIKAMFNQSVGGKEEVKQKIVATDRTDFLTAMEIGAKPVSSCQHYGKSAYNISLLSYVADPNTKIFTVQGEQDQLIARSIARLLNDGENNPVLHLEVVYSASPSPKINELILQFGRLKAKKIGVPLALGSNNQSWSEFDKGNEEKINLNNSASRNTHVYVDSASGTHLAKDGKYKIIGASVV